LALTILSPFESIHGNLDDMSENSNPSVNEFLLGPSPRCATCPLTPRSNQIPDGDQKSLTANIEFLCLVWAMLDKAFRMVDFPPELGPYITVRGLSGTVTPRSPAPLKPLR